MLFKRRKLLFKQYSNKQTLISAVMTNCKPQMIRKWNTINVPEF